MSNEYVSIGRRGLVARWRAGALVLAVAGVALTGCGSSKTKVGGGGVGEGGAKAPLALTGQLTSNDPAKDNNLDIYGVNLLYDALIHMNPDGSFAPQLATEWGYVGEGNKAFELTLRDGATFADGSALDAKAVAAWLKYSKRTGLQTGLGDVSSIAATGPLKVRINLSKPNPVMPYSLSDQNVSGYVASPKCAARPALFAKENCGSGQYILDFGRTTPGSVWQFAPNPKYHDPSSVKFSQVTLRAIGTPTTAFQALQSGQVDAVTLVTSDGSLAGRASSAGFAVYDKDNPSLCPYLALDVDGVVAKPLANVKVRQAMNYAVDRKAIGAAYAGKYAFPIYELVTTDGFDPKYAKYYSYDPAKAKQLLAEAGYPDGFSLSNAIATTMDPKWAKVAQVAAKNLGDVGIKVKYNYAPTPQAWAKAATTSTDSPLLVSASSCSVPMWYQYRVNLPPFNNFGGKGWSDATLNDLFEKSTAASDPKVAASYAKQMTARMVTEALYVPLFATQGVMYADKDIKGIKLTLEHPVALPTEWSRG